MIFVQNWFAVITYPNCKLTREGMEYRGNISVTTSGKTCQRWDRQEPHTHGYDSHLPGNASIHENFCRNPLANETIPWCYTTDPNVRYELCDIPACGNVIFLFKLNLFIICSWLFPNVLQNCVRFKLKNSLRKILRVFHIRFLPCLS